MDALGWIIALVLVYLFAKSGTTFGSANANVPVIENSHPNPYGDPFSTGQNQTRHNTANAPAPWSPSRPCMSTPVLTPVNNPINRTSPLPLRPVATPVRFFQ